MKEINIEEIIEIMVKYGCDDLKSFGAIMEVLRRLGIQCKAINDVPITQTEKIENMEKEVGLCIGFRH
jgi:hypothetical protein